MKFADKFDKAGININDPHYGTWWEKTDHRKKAYEYNQEWDTFFDGLQKEKIVPTKEMILNKGKSLANKYQLKINY